MLSNSLSLTGEDKVIVTAILAIALLVLGAVIVSVFAPAVNTIITSITPAAITAISILAARHPPTTAVSTPGAASMPDPAAPASPPSPTSPATIAS